MIKNRTQRLSVSGFLLALGIVLPYALGHGIGIPGTLLLPMHIPVLLCGFLCGPLWGGVCGALLPLLNCLLTGMPSPFPMLPIMFFELTVYGLVSGVLFSKTPLAKYKLGIYVALPVTMICGRVAYAAAFYALLIAKEGLRAPTVWAAIVAGLPGIIIQLLIIPPIIFAVRRNMQGQNKNIIQSAKNLINNGKASCVVIKDNAIANMEQASGIAPILSLYEKGELRDAVVVDKIIGKAAAHLLVLGGVRACYGMTVSSSAVKLLRSRGISVEYDNCAEHIINRRGDGLCPMEDAVKDITNDTEAYDAIKKRLSELRQMQK